MFLFSGAAVVAVFAFCSIVVWVSAPAAERRSRDRLALLKTLAEHPGENTRQVIELLREEDERRLENKRRAERRGWIVGGLIVMAVGAGLGVMLAEMGLRGEWSVGIIPFLIGCVLLGAGLAQAPYRGPSARNSSSSLK
ncbi:MAG TPA: hypothetical protein VNV86_18185 [Candidatus Acidoferrum sp.]|jgi:hypothetical protein|nr:hypothetical protein [Candidatus Acidoferrum sp.]